MGLDMYLNARKFFWTDYNNEEKQKEEYAKNPLLQDLVEAGIQPKLRYITVEAAYWRKANHIHKWFVDNVQEGEDDCHHYFVSREQLIELKETCQEVLLIPSCAPEVLPNQSGFFFGGTEYDEWYFKDLRNTIEQIDFCLKYPTDWDFVYNASW